MHNKFCTQLSVENPSDSVQSSLWEIITVGPIHSVNPSFTKFHFYPLVQSNRILFKCNRTHYHTCTWVFIFHADTLCVIIGCHSTHIRSSLAPGNAVPRSEIITLAQQRVSGDGWDVCVIWTFQLIAEHLFSHVGESASEIMCQILLKTLSKTASLFVCRLWFQRTDGVSCWPFAYFDINFCSVMPVTK